MQEAAENEMEIHDDSPEAVEVALEFMYTLNYDQTIEPKAPKDDKIQRAQLAMDVYAVADKYRITHLLPSAAEDFRKVFSNTIDEQAIEAIIRAHYDINTQCGHAIGELIAATVAQNHCFFRRKDGFTALLRTVPGFASDIALYAHEKGMFKEYQF